MEWNKSEWAGAWGNFENYIYSVDEEMVQTWKEAEDVCKNHPALSKMFANGCMNFWKKSCDTITENNPVRIGGWDVEETESGLIIEWLDADKESLGRAEYVLDRILEKGLEGKSNFCLIAKDAPQGWAYRCILAMPPMPKREEKSNGGLISHFHYQFAADWDDLILDNKLKKTMWYATMCDREASERQKCNIVRALHKMPVK